MNFHYVVYPRRVPIILMTENTLFSRMSGLTDSPSPAPKLCKGHLLVNGNLCPGTTHYLNYASSDLMSNIVNHHLEKISLLFF